VTSARFLPAIGGCLAVALLPTLLHSYSGRRATDGLTVASIPTTLAGYLGVASDRNRSWGQRRFDSSDWMERDYATSGDSIRLTVVRSYDAKRLYHHPELAVAYHESASWSGHRILRAPSHPTVPVHLLTAGGDRSSVGLYVLHYDGRFVEDPVRFQIRTAGELLFSPRKAMTLLFAFDARVPAGTPVEGLGALRLLLAAVDRFVAPAATAP